MVTEYHEKKNGKDRTTRTEIRIGDKVIRLKFTMPIWIRMEDEICTLDELYTMMHSRGRFEMDKVPALVAMMSGGEVTAEDVLNTDPATMRALMDEAQNVIARAVTMKEKKDEDGSIHDEVLEEIEKKETRAD